MVKGEWTRPVRTRLASSGHSLYTVTSSFTFAVYDQVRPSSCTSCSGTGAWRGRRPGACTATGEPGSGGNTGAAGGRERIGRWPRPTLMISAMTMMRARRSPGSTRGECDGPLSVKNSHPNTEISPKRYL
jgi:hypothetical protein